MGWELDIGCGKNWHEVLVRVIGLASKLELEVATSRVGKNGWLEKSS